jgi:hypothetical protein
MQIERLFTGNIHASKKTARTYCRDKVQRHCTEEEVREEMSPRGDGFCVKSFKPEASSPCTLPLTARLLLNYSDTGKTFRSYIRIDL